MCSASVCGLTPTSSHPGSIASEESKAALRKGELLGGLVALVTIEYSLIAADVIAGGPTGEGIVPAAGIRTAREGLEAGAGGAADGVRLQKQLASESQMSQLAEGGGTVISQPAKQADRIELQTGVDAQDVQKVSSDSFTAKDGTHIETHAFRDASTNELIEPKTIIDPG